MNSGGFDSFATDLKILVKDYGYQEEERMVHDAIVFRCKYSKVREMCLDLADELTIKKAVKIGPTQETNLDSLRKFAKDEDPTVNILEKCQTQSRRKRWEEKEIQITQKIHVGGVGTKKATENAWQWANSAVSAKR